MEDLVPFTEANFSLSRPVGNGIHCCTTERASHRLPPPPKGRNSQKYHSGWAKPRVIHPGFPDTPKNEPEKAIQKPAPSISETAVEAHLRRSPTCLALSRLLALQARQQQRVALHPGPRDTDSSPPRLREPGSAVPTRAALPPVAVVVSNPGKPWKEHQNSWQMEIHPPQNGIATGCAPWPSLAEKPKGVCQSNLVAVTPPQEVWLTFCGFNGKPN